MFCPEFGGKTVEFQAECQAAPDVLPGVQPAEEATPITQTTRPDLSKKPGRGNQFSLIKQLT